MNNEKKGLPEKHVSVSQLNRYRKCGYMDKLYMEHGARPPGILQATGRATHQVVAEHMEHKRETRQLLPIEDIRDRASDAFDLSIADGIAFTEAELYVGEERVLGSAKDFTVLASATHAIEAAPSIHPEYVEAEFVSEEPLEELDGHYIVGRIDLADTSPQLSLYALLYFMATGELPSAVVLDGLWIGKPKKNGTRSSEYVPVASDRDWPQVNNVVAELAILVTARNAGIFMPVDASGPSGWVCSKKWCGYTEICPFYRKERDQS